MKSLYQMKLEEKARLNKEGIEVDKIVSKKGKLIAYIPAKDMGRIIDIWCDTRKMPCGLFICEDIISEDKIHCYSVCEGESGDCYCESFFHEDIALEWLVFSEGTDTDKLYKLDQARSEKEVLA